MLLCRYDDNRVGVVEGDIVIARRMSTGHVYDRYLPGILAPG